MEGVRKMTQALCRVQDNDTFTIRLKEVNVAEKTIKIIFTKKAVKHKARLWTLTSNKPYFKVAKVPQSQLGDTPYLSEVHPGRVGTQELALNVLLHPLQDALLM